jgi:hypothetical protein
MTWKIAPQFGDLQSAEAGFTTLLGKYRASWKRNSKGYTLQFSAPKGTTGMLVLPFVTSPKKPSIKVDGHGIKSGLEYENETVTITVPGGGSHHVVVG